MMDNNVVSLGGGPILDNREPSEALIAHLEDLLERARSGEIMGMAAATLYRDRTTAYSVVGAIEGFSMVGALEMAKMALISVDLEARD